MTSRTTVVVTAVGGGGNGEQLVKALRLADHHDYEIIGTDMSAASKGLYETDHAYIVPPARDAGYLDALLRICDRHEARVLLTGSEPELRVVSRARQVLAERDVFVPMNPQNVIDMCMDKVKTSAFLQAHGFSVPRWEPVRSADDLECIPFAPAVLKPSVGGGGSANLFLAQTREELLTFGMYLLRLYKEFIVQEYVGTPDSEYTVGVLRTMDGELVNSIALRRDLRSAISSKIRVPNQTDRADLGDTLVVSSGFSHGEIGRYPEVAAPCEKIAESLDARGSINVQCRFVNGEVQVFEINPRFSGTTSLRAMVGYNEPDLLIRHHLYGEAAPIHFPYRSGWILRGLSEVLVPEGEVPMA